MLKKYIGSIDQQLISDVEENLGVGSPRQNVYVQIPHSSLIVSKKTIGKSMLDLILRRRSGCQVIVFPKTLKLWFKFLRNFIINGEAVICSADLIIKSSNISLFYFDRGFRVKIYSADKARKLDGFVSEYAIRKKLKNYPFLKSPAIVDSHLQAPPYFFCDEFVNGKVLSWDDSRCEQVIRQVLPNLWRFYQENKIVWLTPEQKKICLSEIINQYNRAIIKKPHISFPFNTEVIEGFSSRLLPCSLIHGDFAIHNIIISEDEVYLTDWELSSFDFIIRDFYRMLIIEGWKLSGDLRHYMDEEMHAQYNGSAVDALNFDEQLYFVLFLEMFRMLDDPDYPERLLLRAQGEISAFFKRNKQYAIYSE